MISDDLDLFNNSRTINFAPMLIEAATGFRGDLVGSRSICPGCCNENTDIDYVVVVTTLLETVEDMVADGWAIGDCSLPSSGEIPATQLFISLRKGLLNVLLTENEGWRNKFLLANRVATQLGLTSKDHRIKLFQAILYGNG